MMIRYCLMLLPLLFIACNETGHKKINDQNQLDWLIGKWQRVNGKPELDTWETWSKDGSQYSAIAVNIQGGDTVYVEKIKIMKEDSNYFYIAHVPQNPTPTRFRLFERSATHFVAENLTHDWPTSISYAIQSDTLVAKISGRGIQHVYYFKKQD